MLDGVFGMCICNDRRWPETFRVLGLQGVEMVVLGFNTPSVNAQNGNEGLAKRMFHHKLSLQAGGYQNSTWVVAVGKSGAPDGPPPMGGSVMIQLVGGVLAGNRGRDNRII